MRFRGSSDNYPSARTLAEARGYDPNPDDMLPPAAHLMPAPGVDALTAFAAEVQAYRELSDLCNECNAYTHEDDAAPSCGAHRVCVPCYRSGHFGCGECDRITDEIRRDDADDQAYDFARDEEST